MRKLGLAGELIIELNKNVGLVPRVPRFFNNKMKKIYEGLLGIVCLIIGFMNIWLVFAAIILKGIFAIPIGIALIPLGCFWILKEED